MENQSAGGSCCQQLAEKLEKSETGRKKLRQAIAMLKEKMEDTSKVLQVNEALRQECEKERKRADAERLKSETDRKVREKVEQESLTLKEQLVQVLKRLDRVEDHQKADQSEIVRVHCMVKEAVDGVGGVLKAVEAAQSSFHTLERNLLAKVVVFSLSIEKLVLGKMIFCQNYIPFLIHCSHICVAACD
jgi:molecular chaperone GrpE (heat shock protein)